MARHRTKNVNFKISSKEFIEIFVTLGEKFLEGINYSLDYSSKNLVYTINGESEEISEVVNNLQDVYNQLKPMFKRTNEELPYVIDIDLLSRFVGTGLDAASFVILLQMNGLDAKIDEKIVITNAKYLEILKLAKQVKNASERLPHGITRVIRRMILPLLCKYPKYDGYSFLFIAEELGIIIMKNESWRITCSIEEGIRRIEKKENEFESIIARYEGEHKEEEFSPIPLFGSENRIVFIGSSEKNDK
ncbi:MAG: DUF2067 family protein [Candidatus Heimdallarchaeota archaeon]|nr:DUF2067 family protein [Candidatus Heimdallarchaeota archaeon]MCK5049042.1 DUF2067 family protein [Candidatus Heimdallarchaeota archaeon]